MRQARVTGLMVTETERPAAFLTVLLHRCCCVYSLAGVEGDARQVHWQQALQAQQVNVEGACSACGQGQQASSSSSCGSWWGGRCQGAEGWPPRQIPCAHPAAQVSSVCARVAAPQGLGFRAHPKHAPRTQPIYAADTEPWLRKHRPCPSLKSACARLCSGNCSEHCCQQHSVSTTVL